MGWLPQSSFSWKLSMPERRNSWLSARHHPVFDADLRRRPAFRLNPLLPVPAALRHSPVVLPPSRQSAWKYFPLCAPMAPAARRAVFLRAAVSAKSHPPNTLADLMPPDRLLLVPTQSRTSYHSSVPP